MTPRLPAAEDPRWLLKTVLSRWRWTVPSGLCMSVSFITNGLIPVIVGRAVDEAIAEPDLRRLGLWIGVLAVSFLTGIVVAWFGRRWMIRAMLVIGHDVRMEVTDRIQDPRGIGGPRRTAGELLSIASSDTQRVADAVFMTVFPVAEIAAVLYVGVMLTSISVPLGLAVLLGGPVLVWVALTAGRPLRKASGRRQSALAQAAATATDVVRGLRIIKGLGAVDAVQARYRHTSDEAYRRTVEANAAQARLNALTESSGSVYVIIVALVAAAQALDGKMSIGELITVIGLTQFVIMPMTMLGRNIASRWAAAQASAARIRKILLAPPALPEERTTVADLPPGLTVVTAGAPADIILAPRDRVVVAPYSVDLFQGSVLDNVHPDEQRARTALHVAAVEDLPGGPEREVGEDGGHLSGGQRQRVALARAIATEAEVLVLQDPTTSVDSVTEARISQRVAEHRGRRPTIVYTTAPAWIAAADRVLSSADEVSV